jgi:hypothetical protein
MSSILRANLRGTGIILGLNHLLVDLMEGPVDLNCTDLEQFFA